TEITLEYEEIITKKYSLILIQSFFDLLTSLPNVFFVNVYFRWDLLQDADDNKFVDCAIASGADYLVTEDRDFDELKRISFPQIQILNIEAFKKIVNLINQDAPPQRD
ncbi:MAG: putative toxin-antitoxin system toxin component, PIN family, partial [Chitinophagales bacterium]